jgi:hypothetical protein
MGFEPGLYFLAVPYEGTAQEKAERYALSLKAASQFLLQGVSVFAPVIYINQIAENLNLSSSEERRSLLMPYLFDFLKVSKGLILITAEGWQDSWGVTQELSFARENNIPIYKVEPEQLNDDLRSLLKNPNIA